MFFCIPYKFLKNFCKSLESLPLLDNLLFFTDSETFSIPVTLLRLGSVAMYSKDIVIIQSF